MSIEDDIQTLARVPLFQSLDLEALRILAFSSDSRTVAAGDVLMRKGKPSEGGFLIMRGSVLLDGVGEDTTNPFIAKPGSLIGEINLITDIPCRINAVMREKGEVVAISRTLFRRVLAGYPSSAAQIRKNMAERLQATVKQLTTVERALLRIS